MDAKDALDYDALTTEYEILYNTRDFLYLFQNLFEENFGTDPVFVSQILREIELKMKMLAKKMDLE